MARSSAVDAACTALPQPYKINSRFVIPWPGFKVPGATGLMKYLATSKDESNIPPPQVCLLSVAMCMGNMLLLRQFLERLMLILYSLSAIHSSCHSNCEIREEYKATFDKIQNGGSHHLRLVQV